MKIARTLVVASGLALALAACAQQEEPPMIVMPEPVYDKYGNVSDGGCPGGQAGAANCVPGRTPDPQGGDGQRGGGNQPGTAPGQTG